ncbi:MAG: hypothetical protein ACP5D7_20565 [Limnospira sp.]
MKNDPVVEEIHKIRADYVAKFNGDIRSIYADIKRREKLSNKKYYRFPPKRIVMTASEE